MWFVRSIAGALCLGTVIVASPRQQPVAAVTGTAVLTGTVVTDSPTPEPVRRAIVRVIGAGGMSSRVTGTDDNGRFAFTALPAGSVTLSATKPGYVVTFHGSSRPGRAPGVPIAIAAGARVDVTLRLLAGAAITGTLTDAFGKPLPGVPVTAVEVWSATTARATSDDRGIYRIFGLAPGDYVVSAIPRLIPTQNGRPLTSAEILSTTDAEVRWASGAGGLAGMPPPGRPVAYAPVFFPGATDAAAAQVLTLSAGQERDGVNMTARALPVSRISGTLVDTSGQPVSPATISLHPHRSDRQSTADVLVSSGALALPRGTVTANGFSIPGVAPGEYTIVARSGSAQRGAPPPDPAGPGPLWSVTDVTVDGNDLDGLELRLLPGLKLSGSIAFDGAPPPTDSGSVDLSFVASVAYLGVASTQRAIVDRAGAFRFSGIPPGTYRLAAVPPVSTAAPWVVKSAMLNGRDLADWPLEVRTGGDDVGGLVITLTNRAAEIGGNLVDASGAPVSRYGIVVFPTDRSYWLPNARRVRLAHPATDGSFVVAGLPPGEYAIAAVTDVEAADLAEPGYLSQLLPSAHTLALAEGERKRQVLRVGR